MGRKRLATASPIARAHQAVSNAVRDGLLQPARELACVDCSGPASEYDHRDYAKPLSVEPVCRSCNQKRGPALNHPRPSLARA